MKTRIAVWGGLTALIVLGIIAWRWTDVRDQRENALRRRLWFESGCDGLATAAIEAREADGRNGSPRGFLPWADWPERLRRQACGDRLVPTRTEHLDGLSVTTFARGGEPEAQFFYVVPDNFGPEGPWFRVVVVAPECCLYTRWPAGTWPVFERLSGPMPAPLDIVRRICARRE